MNTIGIENNLDRARIRKLLIIGLAASIMTGIGDFLVGYGDETAGAGTAEVIMSSALNLSDAQLIWGGLLGAVGLFLEGLLLKILLPIQIFWWCISLRPAPLRVLRKE